MDERMTRGFDAVARDRPWLSRDEVVKRAIRHAVAGILREKSHPEEFVFGDPAEPFGLFSLAVLINYAVNNGHPLDFCHFVGFEEDKDERPPYSTPWLLVRLYDRAVAKHDAELARWRERRAEELARWRERHPGNTR